MLLEMICSKKVFCLVEFGKHFPCWVGTMCKRLIEAHEKSCSQESLLYPVVVECGFSVKTSVIYQPINPLPTKHTLENKFYL